MVRYDPTCLQPAYECRYSWTGWPSESLFPPISNNRWLNLEQMWELDGLRVLEKHSDPKYVQILFSSKPSVSPVFLASRAKGRIDHALRTAGTACQFNRKVALRAIGHNSARAVTEYIDTQVAKEGFVDKEFVYSIEPYTTVFETIDPNQAITVNRGRYWYHLHLVLVHEERYRLRATHLYSSVYKSCLQVAQRNGYQLSAISVMPDHLHLGVIGAIDHSPETIAIEFMNGVVDSLGGIGLYRNGYYVATSGAYGMNAIRIRND